MDAKILMIGNDPEQGVDTQQVLSQMGYQAAAADWDAGGGIAEVAETEPEVVIVDVALGSEPDGLEAVEQIRQRVSVPTILVTGDLDWAAAHSAECLGLCTCILRPFHEQELAISIKTAIWQHEIQTKLEKAEAQFRALIEHATDMIIVADQQGVIRHLSSSVERVLGYSPEHFIGQSLLSFIYPGDALDVFGKIRNSLGGPDAIVSAEARVQDASGAWRVLSAVARNRLDDPVVGGIVINAHDVTERVNLRDFNETIVKGIAEAILLFDADGVATFANPAAERLWGYPPDEIVGRHWAALCPQSELWDLGREQTDSARLGQGAPGHPEPLHALEQREIVITNQQGALVPTISSACKLSDGDDHYSILVTFTDITARKEAEDAVRHQADVLQARNEELDAFAHTAAHDLKSPLGYMVGFSELLLAEYDNLKPGERAESLRAIAKGGRRMASVIDELLLLASMRKLEDVELRPLDMKRLVGEVLLDLEYMIEDYGGEVIVPDEWPPALGTSMWVGEVWTNYISNALKYGGNPPVLELGATSVDGAQEIRFWVRDNGGGLTEEQHKKLFEPFSRAESAGVPGYGLGLSIVKRIVARLGGEVSLESTPGEGSVFSFTLKAC